MIRGNVIISSGGRTWVWIPLVAVLVVQGVTTKATTTTTKDTLIYESDPQQQQQRPPRVPPGPSIFDYVHSSHVNSPHEHSSSPSDAESKVKRANVHPRYYEMVEDEVYVFEPSELGMSPFMEAMQSDFQQNVRGGQESQQRPQGNEGNQHTPYNRFQQGEGHSGHPHHQYNRPPPPPQSHNPPIRPPPPPSTVDERYVAQSRPQQGGNSIGPHTDIPSFEIRQEIPVIQKIPILIPHPNSQSAPQEESQLPNSQVSFPSEKSEEATHKSRDSPPQSRDNPPQSRDSPPQSSNNPPTSFQTQQPYENSLIPRHGTQCTTSNDKDGQCVAFRACYPVVFNSVDGQLRDSGLAKILFQAAGVCDPSHQQHGTQQAKKEQVIPGITENDPNIPPDFFNHSICCASFYLSNNRYETSESSEPKTMRPSPPDPRQSPPEFQEQTTQQSHSQFDQPEFDIEDSSSDDYGGGGDEDYSQEEEDYVYTSIETPKLVPKKVKTKSNSTEESKEKEKKATGSNVEMEATSSSPKSIKVIKKKVKKTSVVRDVEGGFHKEVTSSNDSSSSPSSLTKPSKEGGLVPFIMEAPELSAWKCPGRKGGMPRGHWPWMVALLNEGNHFCSGSLIDHRHILTSSSCVAPFQGKDIGRLRVILGDRVLYSSVDGPHLWRNVVRIARHLNFDPLTMQNDIALIEMEYPVSYTRTIQPINLPASSNHSHISRGIISGWSGADIGSRRFFSPRSTIDSVAEFLDPAACSTDYSGFLSTGDLLCTKPTPSSCMADPGGPLMVKTGTCWHAVGILSHGLRCGSFPDLFTPTANFLPWIHNNIKKKPLQLNSN